MAEARLVLPIPPGKHWTDELPVLLPVAPSEAKQIADQEPKRRKAAVAKPLVVAQRKPVNRHGGLFFASAEPPASEKVAKPNREKKPKAKNDPKLVAAARELRDRWLEHVNAAAVSQLAAQAKYDVSRTPSASAT